VRSSEFQLNVAVCVAVCRSVLQCVAAVCCSVLQCARLNSLPNVALCIAVCRSLSLSLSLSVSKCIAVHLPQFSTQYPGQSWPFLICPHTPHLYLPEPLAPGCRGPSSSSESSTIGLICSPREGNRARRESREGDRENEGMGRGGRSVGEGVGSVKGTLENTSAYLRAILYSNVSC